MVHLIRQLIADRSEMEAIRARVLATTVPHHDEHMQWISALYQELAPVGRFVRRTREPVRGNTIRDLGILLVEPNWVIVPRGASVVDEGSGPMPVLPVGVLRQAYRFYKKNGTRNTFVRIVKEVLRRMGVQA
jgi:hypothetical protein